MHKLLLLLSQLSFSKQYLLAHLLLPPRIPLFHRIVTKAISYKAIVRLQNMYFLTGQPRTGRLLSGAWVARPTVVPIVCKEVRQQVRRW